jgi:hypothetical protein
MNISETIRKYLTEGTKHEMVIDNLAQYKDMVKANPDKKHVIKSLVLHVYDTSITEEQWDEFIPTLGAGNKKFDFEDDTIYIKQDYSKLNIKNIDNKLEKFLRKNSSKKNNDTEVFWRIIIQFNDKMSRKDKEDFEYED